jgi:hypothetical protein
LLLAVGCSSDEPPPPEKVGVVGDQSVYAMRKEEFVFLADEAGENAAAFCRSLEAVFSDYPELERAYLVKTKYPDEEDEWVMLALIGTEDEALVKECVACLQEVSGRTPPLDIAFLSESDEARVEKVAKPFYRRPTSARTKRS